MACSSIIAQEKHIVSYQFRQGRVYRIWFGPSGARQSQREIEIEREEDDFESMLVAKACLIDVRGERGEGIPLSEALRSVQESENQWAFIPLYA